jgi:hypothetical protein
MFGMLGWLFRLLDRAARQKGKNSTAAERSNLWIPRGAGASWPSPACRRVCIREQACVQTNRDSTCMCAHTWRQTQSVCRYAAERDSDQTAPRATGCDRQAHTSYKRPGRELGIAREQAVRCLLSLLLLRSYNHHHQSLPHQSPGPGQPAVRSCLPQLLYDSCSRRSTWCWPARTTRLHAGPRACWRVVATGGLWSNPRNATGGVWCNESDHCAGQLQESKTQRASQKAAPALEPLPRLAGGPMPPT